MLSTVRSLHQNPLAAHQSPLAALPALWTVLLTLGLLCAACTSLPPKDLDETQEILPVPADRVRSAMMQVLKDGGYEVKSGDGEDRVVTTGYREEMDSPWDWLYRARFGMGRSRVDVTLSPQGDQATHVTIHVTYEGKNSLFESWKPFPTPLAQSAGNQLRLVKNALGLLPRQPEESL